METSLSELRDIEVMVDEILEVLLQEERKVLEAEMDCAGHTMISFSKMNSWVMVILKSALSYITHQPQHATWPCHKSYWSFTPDLLLINTLICFIVKLLFVVLVCYGVCHSIAHSCILFNSYALFMLVVTLLVWPVPHYLLSASDF